MSPITQQKRSARVTAPRAKSSGGPGRPKDPEKRAAILDAAKKLFPERGFEGVSMDAIAAEAGVSKLTLYSHFADKDALFREAVMARCEDQLPHAFFEPADQPGDIRERLLTIARAFYALVSSEETLSMYRMMAAQAPGKGKLAQLFFDAGPRRILEEFEQMLERECASGSLQIGDCRSAAEQFFCLTKGVQHMRCLIGLAPTAGLTPPSKAGDHVAAAVGLFLRAYAAPEPVRAASRRPPKTK